MMKWEEKLRAWLCRHALLLAWLAVLAMGLALRWVYWPHLSIDMDAYNLLWYDALRSGGVPALLSPDLRFNYTPLHIYLWLAEARLLPQLSTLTALKLANAVFELALLPVACLLAKKLLPKEKQRWGCLLTGAALWLNPVLLWNITAWGQTDVIYLFFTLLAVLLLIRDRPEWGVVCLGLAQCWKLQALFLLPLFIFAYFAGNKRFSLLWFLALPALPLATGFPMALFGQSPLFTVQTYLGQTILYKKLTYGYANLYALLGEALPTDSLLWKHFASTGMVLGFTVLGLTAVWLIQRKTALQGESLILAGAWSVLCTVFFMPRMHERYAIAGDVLLLVWAVCHRKPRCWLYVLINLLTTLSAYAAYLYASPFFDAQLGAVLNLALLLALSYELYLAASQTEAALQAE